MGVSGGKSQGVYVVTEAEVASGRFRVRPGAAVKVSGLQSTTRGVLGGNAIPVYVVSNPSVRGVEGGAPVPVSNLTGIRVPVGDLAIPIYVESDDGQFASPDTLWSVMTAYYPLDDAANTLPVDIKNGIDAELIQGTEPTRVDDPALGSVIYPNNLGYYYLYDERMTVVDSDTTDFSGFVWFNPDSTTFGLIASINESGGSREWLVFWSGGAPHFYVFYNSTDAALIAGPTVTTAAWHLVAYKFDHTTQRSYISVDGATFLESAAALPSPMLQGNWAYNLGGGSKQPTYFDGKVSRAGWLNGYGLTDADAAFLWNGGTPRTVGEMQSYEVTL